MENQEQINQLRNLASDFTKKVDVLTRMNMKATSKLDHENMKNVAVQGNDLKKAINSAMNGDSKGLTKFIDKHANSNK